MKRLGRLWTKICTVENGIDALIEGTKRKRCRKETQRFLYSPEDVARDPALYHQIDPEKARDYIERNILPRLLNNSWNPKEPYHKRIYSYSHTKKKGKWRELYIPAFDDHIIMHMIMRQSMPAFTRGMHPNCCGSVDGRGTKHIIKYVKKWVQKNPDAKYFVKLDIRHYFDTIDSDILMQKLREKIKDKYVLESFQKLINASPVACPLGFYSSPYFANLYLQDLDWFIEQELYKTRRVKRIKFVDDQLRYMDDILLIGSSKSDLEKAVKAIITFTSSQLHLTIKPNWEIKKIGSHVSIDGIWKMPKGEYWIDIGGYKFSKDAVVMRDGIFLVTARLAKKMHSSGFYTLHQCQSLNSRLGWASHCDSVYFNEEYIESYVDIPKTRRIIANVSKKREQRINPAACYRKNQKWFDYQA